MKRALYLLFCFVVLSVPSHAKCGIGTALDTFNNSEKTLNDYNKVFLVVTNNMDDDNKIMDFVDCTELELRRADDFYDDMQDLLEANGNAPNAPPIQAIHQVQRRIRHRLLIIAPDKSVKKPYWPDKSY